jgi:hypothetical protein
MSEFEYKAVFLLAVIALNTTWDKTTLTRLITVAIAVMFIL